ncbi:hypothetical protein F4825DRAFT_446163 [Nemania diffusa]|nr:hypothetical protein F4825DRAFT_446163 [Nemania diffusa]
MAPIKKLESWLNTLQDKPKSKSSHQVPVTGQHRDILTKSMKQNNEDYPAEKGHGFTISHPIQNAIEHTLLSAPKSPKIDSQNLGSANEALHSHPTGMWFDNSPQSNKEIKKQHRKLVICERDEDDYVLIRPSRPSTSLLAEPQRGHVFPMEAEAWFQEFPQFENSKTNEERVEQIADRTTPTIRITSPPEGDVDQTFLSADDALKILLKNSDRENRRLQHLRPLALLIAEHEGIDVRDTTALVTGLQKIIDDRKQLSKLIPLANMLCQDQGINLSAEAFDSLPRALDQILKERRAAKFAAQYNKRAKQSLECRVNRLEAQLSEIRYDGDEDYIRY